MSNKHNRTQKLNKKKQTNKQHGNGMVYEYDFDGMKIIKLENISFNLTRMNEFSYEKLSSYRRSVS